MGVGEPHNVVERIKVVTQDGRRERRSQAGSHGDVHALHNAREGAGAANRIIDLSGWTIQADLDSQTRDGGVDSGAGGRRVRLGGLGQCHQTG